jgi:hypothetical protein
MSRRGYDFIATVYSDDSVAQGRYQLPKADYGRLSPSGRNCVVGRADPSRGATEWHAQSASTLNRTLGGRRGH